ncbi:coniferyl aldehyde dehydrogenase [Tahibacter soli]|uniref:Aldehyde dehydrogenase n=1 Tax=Tahibacter soli TaxID=2983605 RepID=A0A9X4BLI5_9GAMM|nr:coniferyl aldehyde dehydrogenase [Tahibacter soli]MDC8014279.1 coniferyl aldehyde dehydrogenase [Tahibacter soli]
MDTPQTAAPAGTADLDATLARLRAAWQSHTPDYRQRMDDLARLRDAFKRRLDDLIGAMNADFGRRSRHESLLSDGMTVLHEIDLVRRNLRRWMRPQGRAVDWTFLPARAEIRWQPLGVVGVIAPWNYPVNLALIPLVSAIGAGNHVMLKPSEHTPRTSDALAALLAEVFPGDRVATVLGGPDVAAAFAGLPLDHLLFTGSTEVGRKVMAAAAPNLTPVTLELGGKSPAIVAPDFPIDVAAARIAAGKFLNAGQTCIAPDYVLIRADDRERFVDALRAYVARHYPNLRESPDYTSIVNERQYARLHGLVDDARRRGATVVTLPDDAAHDPAARVFAPTLVIDAPDDARVMQEEIFGPILPIVAAPSVDAAIAYVNARPRPLALYHFDRDRGRTRKVLDSCVAGGASVNDCLLHNAQGELPFGGVGPSGMGHYHGHHGFVTFSKQLPVFHQARFSSLSLLRPPYKGLADFMTRFLTR